MYDESYWEMNESLRVCPDNTAVVFKSTAAPIIYVIKEIRNLGFFCLVSPVRFSNQGLELHSRIHRAQVYNYYVIQSDINIF